MKCPYCSAKKSRVTSTQVAEHKSLPDPVKWRRRACRECKKPFHTYEVYGDDYRRMIQVIESADLLEELSGCLRTRLNLPQAKEKK